MANSPRIHKPTPVLVGGTGRSGTTVLGHLLNEHEDIRTSTPIEIKFLANKSGLLDLTYGWRAKEGQNEKKVSILQTRTYLKRKANEKTRDEKFLAEFVENMWGKWWKYDAPVGHGTGLASGISREKMESLIDIFLADFKEDRSKASYQLFYQFVSAQYAATSEKFWVDTTPLNIANADRIHNLIPEALFINMVRDPRDVIASYMSKKWGPTTPVEGIDWIFERLLKGHQALQDVPTNLQLTISLEDLVIKKREETYKHLLDFLGASDSPAMHRYFDENMKPTDASSGRWKFDINEPEFERKYAQMLSKLKELGVKVGNSETT